MTNVRGMVGMLAALVFLVLAVGCGLISDQGRQEAKKKVEDKAQQVKQEANKKVEAKGQQAKQEAKKKVDEPPEESGDLKVSKHGRRSRRRWRLARRS